MTTFNDLRNAIDRLLNLTAVHSLLRLNSSTCERAYEAYILGLCVEAVRRAGGTITPTGINTGPHPARLVLRGAPGSMSSTSQDFCYMDCSLGSRRFEIHVDVEYEGKSGATHEIDVSICDKEHCKRSRRDGILPKARKNLLMVFECKFYDHSTPSVALARTFVGLLSDCTKPELSGFVSNITTSGLRNYLANSSRPEPFDPIPSSVDSEERFIRNVEQALRRWARV